MHTPTPTRALGDMTDGTHTLSRKIVWVEAISERMFQRFRDVAEFYGLQPIHKINNKSRTLRIRFEVKRHFEVPKGIYRK